MNKLEQKKQRRITQSVQDLLERFLASYDLNDCPDFVTEINKEYRYLIQEDNLVKTKSLLIENQDVKFIHLPNFCMSFGLYVDGNGNGFIAISAAAREGNLLSSDSWPSCGEHKEDTYSKKHARSLITQRLNHYIGLLPARNYTNSQIQPIGKVIDPIAIHKQMVEIIRAITGDDAEVLFVDRKTFVLGALYFINEALQGLLDTTNIDLVDDFWREFNIHKVRELEAAETM